MPETVIVGVSGGVDSAVAALLLQQRGFAVQGLFMSNWDEDDAYCTIADDFQDARRVCDRLRIPLHRVSFAAEYRERVFAFFLREYRAGRTPNPDVLCNRDIKFGVALTYMQRLGADRIATGHYARLAHGQTGTSLLRAADASKDQTYFLHAVAPAALQRSVFPIGDLQKSEVRKLAHAHGLAVHDKPDSTGICFIGERPFRDFLTRYVDITPGPIEGADGTFLGSIAVSPSTRWGNGPVWDWGGRRGASEAPWYVAGKDVQRNALVVVQDHDHALLLSDHFSVADLHWLSPPPQGGMDCSVKTRYRQRDLPCHVELRSDGGVVVGLRCPARAVTPGQYAVFYSGDQCLGGGVIVDRALQRPIAYNQGLLQEVS